MATEAEIRATVDELVRAAVARMEANPDGDVTVLMVTTDEPVTAEHLARRIASAAGQDYALRPGEGVWFAPERGFIVAESSRDGLLDA